MNPTASHSLGKTLIIHSGALGDTVLMLRVAQALRVVGAHEVHLLGRPTYRDLLLSTGCIDGHLNLETGGFHRLFSPDAALSVGVQKTLGEFDLVVNMLGADAEITAHFAEARMMRIVHIDPKPNPRSRRHITDQWLDVLNRGLTRLGLPSAVIAQVEPPTISLETSTSTSSQRERADTSFPKPGAILVHPGSGSRAKCWPLDRFVSIARLLRKGKHDIAFVIGPVEQELLTMSEHRQLREAASIFEPTDLIHLADGLRSAPLLIGNDSGVSHLVAALGTPVIALFGPTSPVVWRPMGRTVKILRARSRWPAVNDVLAAARRMLN